MSESSVEPPASPPSRSGQWAFIAVFVAANLIVPLLIGDLFPFTSSPMFRDQPRQYCNYRVFAPDGRELPAEDFLVQRIYDGNPPGMGVGIKPPFVLERVFGEVADKRQVMEHIQAQLKRHPQLAFVEVEQEIVTGKDDAANEDDANNDGGLAIHTNRWRIERVETE